MPGSDRSKRHRDGARRHATRPARRPAAASQTAPTLAHQFWALFESAADAVLTIDSRSVILAANPAVERIFGYRPDELVGRPLAVLLPERLRSWHQTGLRRHLAAARRTIRWPAVELTGRHRSGLEVALEVSFGEFRWKGRRFFTGIVRDVTERARAQEALHASEERFRSFVETTTEWIWACDREGGMTYTNPAVEQILGRAPADLMGAGALANLHPEDRAHVRALLPRAAAERRGWTGLVLRWKHRDGGWRYLESNAVPVFGERGDVVGFRGTDRDITGRRLVEHTLRARALQQAAVVELGQRALAGLDLAVLFEQSVSAVAHTLDIEHGAVLQLLPGTEALRLLAGVGWKARLVGQATVGAGRASQAGYTLLTGGAVVVADLRRETRFDGGPLLLQHGVVSGVGVPIPGRDRPFGVLGAYARTPRDFSADDVNFLQAVANVLATAILRRGDNELRRWLIERLISAQDEESRRIARELHDETGQSLTALLVGLRRIEGARSLAEARAAAHELRGLAARTVDDVGRLARGLHPSILDDLGLAAAVTRHAEDFGRSCGMTVEVEVDGLDDSGLPAVIANALYRILQEALTNVARHASAARVRVQLSRPGGDVLLSVEDDGVGFDSRLALSAARGHFGLHGMRERAALLAGTMQVVSRPGGGTRVSVTIPLQPGSDRPGAPPPQRAQA